MPVCTLYIWFFFSISNCTENHMPSFAAGLTDNRSIKCWWYFEQHICRTSCICIITYFLCLHYLMFSLARRRQWGGCSRAVHLWYHLPHGHGAGESLWRGKEIASFLTKENPPYTPVAATSLLNVLHWSPFVFNCTEVKEKVCVWMCVYNIGAGSMLLCRWE